jgi:hypothetical protein
MFGGQQLSWVSSSGQLSSTRESYVDGTPFPQADHIQSHEEG